MQGVESGEYDLLIACDVLEHVKDDKLAMREVSRVLRGGGYAILTVPQKDGLEVTYEDPTITDPLERKKHFGQLDHLRFYGQDFPRFLEAAGFQVAVVDEKSFPEAIVKKHVLFPPILSTTPLATNYRKVFFAHKSLKSD
jgi:SAM-dependent methyltransferase